MIRSDHFIETTNRAVSAVSLVDWPKTFGHDHGGCIPIAFFVAEFYKAAGYDARSVEAGVRVTDPLNVRWAEIETFDGSPSLEARDEPGLPFLGHLVTHLPTLRLIVDMSLPTQRSTVMRNLPVPDCLIGEYDHTRGETGFQTRVGTGGRGTAAYRIYRRRNGWRQRRWPWGAIRILAQEAQAQSFDGTFEVEWSRGVR